MATPILTDVGTFTTGTDTGAIPMPPDTDEGDVVVLFVGTADKAVTIASPDGWARAGSSPSRNPVGPDICRMSVFWKRADAGEPDVDIAVAGSGNYFIAQTARITGAAPSGNPWNFTSASIGASFDADAEAYLDAIGETDPAVRQAYTVHVLDLKAAGLWSKCPAIFPINGGDSTKHRYDLKTATAVASFVGSGGHDANGFTANGTSRYMNLNILADSLDDNDCGVSIYSRTNNQTDSFDIGVTGGGATGDLGLAIRDTSNNTQGYTGSIAERTLASNTDSRGFFTLTRRSTTAAEQYKNGVSQDTDTGTNSGSISSLNIFVGAANFNGTPIGSSTREYCYVALHSGLTDTEAADFYTAVQRLQTSLGRHVGTPVTSPGASGTSMIMPGGATTLANSLVLASLAAGTSANGSGRFSSLTNPTLGSLTEEIDEGFNSAGDEGALFVASGGAGGAGPFDETTVEMDAPSSYAAWTGAICDTETVDDAPPASTVEPAASLSDFEELILADTMNIDEVRWMGETLRADFGAGFGAFAVVGHAAGLHKWGLSSSVMPAAASYGETVNGLNTFDYYFDFFKRHTTGDREIFWIRFRGKKYHACFAEPDVSYERFTDDLFGGGVEIVQRRVPGIYYLDDGSIFYPSDLPGAWGWYLPEGIDIAGLTWTDAMSGAGPDPDITDAANDLVLEGDVILSTDQCNGLSVARFNSVAGDGRAHNTGVKIYEAFFLMKIRGGTFPNNCGVLTGTGASSPIVLSGVSGDVKFANQSFGGAFLYSLNGEELVESAQAAPMDTYGVVRVSFPTTGFDLSAGLQLMKKRTTAGTFAPADLCEAFFVKTAALSDENALHMVRYMLLRGGPDIG